MESSVGSTLTLSPDVGGLADGEIAAGPLTDAVTEGDGEGPGWHATKRPIQTIGNAAAAARSLDLNPARAPDWRPGG